MLLGHQSNDIVCHSEKKLTCHRDMHIDRYKYAGMVISFGY